MRCWAWRTDGELLSSTSAVQVTTVTAHSLDRDVLRTVAVLDGDWCLTGLHAEAALLVGLRATSPGGTPSASTMVERLDLATGERHAITTIERCNVALHDVSPDGRLAVGSAGCDDGAVLPDGEASASDLLVIDLASGAMRRMRGGAMAVPSFTPDGTSVIATDLAPSGMPETSRIVRIDLESGARTTLVEGDRSLWPAVLSPEWQPR